MQLPVQPAVPVKKPTDWLTIFQLVFSIGVFLASAGSAVLMFFSVFAPDGTGVSIGILGALIGLVFALISLTSVVWAIRKLSRPEIKTGPTKEMKWMYWLVFLLPVVVLVGSLIANDPGFGAWLLPVLTVAGIIIPAFWFLRVGARNSWGQNPQRDSGLLTLSFGFTTGFIMFVEAMVMAILGLIVLIFVMSNPSAQAFFEGLVRSFGTTGPDPESLLKALEPLLSNPWVIAGLLLVMAVIVPIIEELLKTLGVWLLAGRKITPAEGWVAGLMSGAGFALMEGLLFGLQVSATTPSDWTFFIIGRVGGTLMHILFGGLIGWAFAKTWQDKKALRVIGMYLVAIIFHGLWNGLALLGGLNPMLDEAAENPVGSYIPLAIDFILLLAVFLNFSNKVEKARVACTNPS